MERGRKFGMRGGELKACGTRHAPNEYRIAGYCPLEQGGGAVACIMSLGMYLVRKIWQTSNKTLNVRRLCGYRNKRPEVNANTWEEV